MKPFILQYIEKNHRHDESGKIHEYSHSINLNVIKGTQQPAISRVFMETETFTKTGGEGTDSDRDSMASYFETQTHTRIKQEITDSDN